MAGSMVGSISSMFAKKLEEEMLWELRNEVVVINAEGKKLETDLMYWDMKKEIVYSDRYSRLTSGDQIIEGNKGFKSEQSLNGRICCHIDLSGFISILIGNGNCLYGFQ